MEQSLYAITDTQGRLIGLYTNLYTARDALVRHADSIIDNPVLESDPNRLDDNELCAVFESGFRACDAHTGGLALTIVYVDMVTNDQHKR